MTDYSELRHSAEWAITDDRMCAILDFRKYATPKAIIELLRELEALRAQVKPPKPKRDDYPADFMLAYAAMEGSGTKWRSGSTLPAAFKAWKARIAAGATPAEIQMGAEKYARYCAATGCEVKQAQVFFGPGEYFSADWTISKPATGTARPGKFDPVAHVNKGKTSEGGWDGIIDITPR